MITIRPYTSQDVPAIAGLIGTLGYPATADVVAQRMSALSPDHRTLLAEVGGEVAGFIGLVALAVYEHSSRIGYILALSVSPDHQRQGVGKKLLQAAENCFHEMGVGDIRVSSGLHREEAHRFYEAAGYERTGFRFRKVLAEGG
jgi:ribosomal protein S18 acetylase RimI-like enzyme